MFVKLISTNKSLAMFFVRLPLGIAMVVHGWGKVTNVPGWLQYCDNLGIPPFLAYLSLVAEFFGGLGVIVGCLSRIAAFGTGFTMLVAAIMRHVLPGYGYLMDWHAGTPWGAEGWEYHTYAVAIAAGVMIAGAGAFSVDYYWSKAMIQARERLKVSSEAVTAGAHGD